MSREAFMRGVREEFDRLYPESTDADELDERDGRRAVLLASSDVLWRRHLGELLDTDQVQTILNLGTRAAVAERVKRHTLLALPGTGRAQRRFPAWQFAASGKPYPQLRSVLAAFAEAGVTNRWTLTSWFCTPQLTLDDTEPARWIAEGRDEKRLLEAAQMTANTLAA